MYGVLENWQNPKNELPKLGKEVYGIVKHSEGFRIGRIVREEIDEDDVIESLGDNYDENLLYSSFCDLENDEPISDFYDVIAWMHIEEYIAQISNLFENE